MAGEKRLQTKILKDLRSLGKRCECCKIEKTSDNAIMDIFFTTKETGGVWIETKRPKNEKSSKGEIKKLQTKKIKSFNECGSKAFPCYSWEEWVALKKSLGLVTNMLS